ncbi:PVC-type heme-binding CxxCH protein [Haliscomenobacter sp.]|uniref:PVC-type heme-binding CxxCH protein n=1 Tax=Haliscomenobacter sp. TaxID=2717303 RepID=UPI0035946FB9
MKKLIVLSLLFCVFSASAQKARRLEVLFLGDNGHHRPIERVPWIMSALGDKGVNFTYTDKLADLNLANLNKYDALMIYANWDSIPPAAEKDLLAYVAAGKGIIPIHCASFCFRNSSEYVKMVGGQFWRHRMDTIQTTTVQPEHVIMQGLKPFKAFDETYLHSKLQPDNNVLAVREIKADQFKDKPDTKTEPYTWTRSYGKGRVFYTAYGHDANAWQNEGFHALILRGILWAVDDEARKAHAALKPEAFVYREAKLPNYEKRPGIQYRQDPLSPEESMKHIQVPVEFNLELFAAEPNVMHPIAISWDERGRLYVLITKDYPNERKPGGGSDYILICEDTNKDGKADKFTRFAEGLSIPTGMVFSNGGLVISQAPDMLFLKDTDGDDKADVRQVLFTGFGTFDTHAGPSNLHYGFDNWLWGSVGYSGFKGVVGGSDTIRFSQGFFRFKPDGSKLEYVTRTSNNTWGLGFNETGDVFGSTANNAHGWYMAIPNQSYPSANGIDNGSTSIDTHKDMKTITPKVRQVDVFGGFTAAAGHNVYTARAFPKKYWNNIAFIAEPTGHVLHQNVLAKSGTNYSDVEGFNLMAGADEWFSPVFAEVGPDGAVWVADWYSFIIQHNPRPEGFVMGTGNAYETDLRDYTHGRIYRVSYKEAAAYQALALSKDKPQELLAALKNTNMFWRSHAQRILVERNQKDVVPGLLALIRDKSVDEIGINAPAIHALWTLHGLNALEGEALNVVVEALKHPCPGVRKTAVQILPRNKASVDVVVKNKTLEDQEPLVVLQALLAISEMPMNEQVETLILQAMESSKEHLNDRWLPDAYASILGKNPGLLKKVFAKLQEKAAAKAKTMNDAAGHNDHADMMAKTETKTQPSATPTQPDLIVSNVSFEVANPMPRERVALSVELRNQGGVDIPKGVAVPLNMRFVGQWQTNDIPPQVYSEGIKAGETVTINKLTFGTRTVPLGVTPDRAGEYTFTATVDRANTIVEGNEANNVFTKKITVALSQSMEQYVLAKAVRSTSSLASVEVVVDYLKNAQKLDKDGFNVVLKSISEGWDYRKKVTVNAADKSYLNTVLAASTGLNKERLVRLMQSWEVVAAQAENDPSVLTIKLKAIREMLQFDQKTFTVKAGKTVEIVFENPDAMQHNLVIGKPKSLEKIGKAADKMITDPEGATKNYVPDVADVLFSTALVNPDQTVRLRFTAPAKAGDYPYVCTFPGHWRIMNGVMKVE